MTAPTISRGATTLSPTLVLGLPLSRPAGTVVHPLLSGGVSFTVRRSGPRAGTLRLLFSTWGDAAEAEAALAVAGDPWVWTIPTDPVTSMTAHVTGPISVEPGTSDGLRAWVVSVDVTEVPA